MPGDYISGTTQAEVDVPTSNVWRQVDLLLEGKLAQRLTELRSAGTSTEQIARTLLTEHGAIVSTRTIGNWCKQLGIPFLSAGSTAARPAPPDASLAEDPAGGETAVAS